MSTTSRLNRIVNVLVKDASSSSSNADPLAAAATTTSQVTMIVDNYDNDDDDNHSSDILKTNKRNREGILLSESKQRFIGATPKLLQLQDHKRKRAKLHSDPTQQQQDDNSKQHSTGQATQISSLQSMTKNIGEDNRTATTTTTISRNDDDSKAIIESVQVLRNVYLYGLQTVSNLQDLRDAPDAILPGNFCHSSTF
jgi:hypothetical protein